jgi:phospholipase/carboxylesterase
MINIFSELIISICSPLISRYYCNIHQTTPAKMHTTDPVIVESSKHPDAAVIWLHGLGADGYDLVPVVNQLQLPANPAIRHIFPHAPVRPITLNQGYQMPGWYDINSLAFGEQEDVSGIQKSSGYLAQLCNEQQMRGIPSGRIILAGFSQGGAIALHCGCRYPQPLAGIIALSTYLVLPDTLAHEKSENFRQIPIFMAHGRQDEVIAYHYAKQSRMLLEKYNSRLEWHEYNMGHAICTEEMNHIGQWILNVL